MAQLQAIINKVCESVHLYSEMHTKVSTVPGGRKQVCLQCMREGVLWQLWCS